MHLLSLTILNDIADSSFPKSKNNFIISPFCVNFVEFAQKREAEHGYNTVAVFCDVFPKICGDVL